jgi:hypothetical protein
MKPLTPTGGSSSAVDRLRIYLCLSVEAFERKFPKRVNVYNKVYGRHVMKTLSGPCYVLGKEAWRCLGLPASPFFTQIRRPGLSLRLLPHTSGKNLMYNDPALRRRVRRLLCHTP